MEYQHGGDIYSREILWDFSANINPLGPPEGVKEAVRRSADFCGVYPDSRCRRLVEGLSRHHRLPEQAILCGNGAADLIFQIAFAERPGHAWLPAPTFSEYEQALKGAGAQIHPVFLHREESFCLRTEELMDAIQGSRMGALQDGRRNFGQNTAAGILFLCNPNNPIGLAVRRSELKRLAEFAEQNGIRMVVDECFLDFLEEPGEYSLIPDLFQFPHLVIVKAFTKLYGMAGLRLGYCLTQDRTLLDRMERIRQPWSVSSVAQAAGEAALKETNYLERTSKIIQAGRTQLTEGLRELGFWVCDSQANYIFFQDVRAGAEDGRLYQACRERKLLLRSCGNFRGLDKSYYRICVKTERENEHLLQMLKEYFEADR